MSKSRLFKIKWRKEGKCSNCGGDLSPNRKQCERCLSVSREKTRKYRKNNPNRFKEKYYTNKESGLCVHCGEKPHREKSLICEECSYREWCRRLQIKNLVIQKYGGSCKCCGEDKIAFLSLDHIYGGGTKERTLTKIIGGRLYKYLKNKPVDPRYQVLCYNCNFAKGDRGVCPHGIMNEFEKALNWKPSEPKRNRMWCAQK